MPETTEPQAQHDDLAERLTDLLGCLSLYISWRPTTRHLTTEQKELFADAVDAWSRRLNEEDPDLDAVTPADRWWRRDDARPAEPAPRPAVAPDPPEIAAARQLVAYHAALGWPTVTLNVSLLGELLGSIDYLRNHLNGARVQRDTIAAKYDAALSRLHALQVLAGNWEGRAAERSTDTAATLRACARELRAALDDGQPMPYTPGAFTNIRRFALEAARNGNIRRTEPLGWHDPLGHRYNDVARWLIQHGLAVAAGDVLAPTEAGIAALDGTT